MERKPDRTAGFVSLSALKRGAPEPQAALAEIRRIYFRTTKDTIQHDLAHAIELLKSLPTEEERENARVYMDGLAQMRSEWAGRRKGGSGGDRRRETGDRRKKEEDRRQKR